MNNVSLLGRLTKDIDLNFAKGTGTAVAKFTLAVNRPFKKDETDFLNCIAFGKTAEILSQYVFKGQQLAVTGHIQTGSFENKEGKKVYTTDIVVNAFDFIGNNKGEANNNTVKNDDLEPVSDGEDIPF